MSQNSDIQNNRVQVCADMSILLTCLDCDVTTKMQMPATMPGSFRACVTALEACFDFTECP